MHGSTAEEDICENRDQVSEVVDGSRDMSAEVRMYTETIDAIHCGAHHCVEGSTRPQVNTAQEGNDHADAKLCVEGRAESGMNTRPTEIVSRISIFDGRSFLHSRQREALVSGKSPKNATSTSNPVRGV